jgi:hypothetical protein
MSVTTINADIEVPEIVVSFKGKEYRGKSDYIFIALLEASESKQGDPDRLGQNVIYGRFSKLLEEILGWPELPMLTLINVADSSSASVTELKKKSEGVNDSSSSDSNLEEDSAS